MKLATVQKNSFIAGMLLLPILHFVIFWIVVNFNSLLLAFQRMDPGTGEIFYTWANFRKLPTLFQYDYLKTALTNTLYTFLFLTVFMLPWGFFVTYFLYKKIALSAFWRTMLFVPTILPAVAMTSIFIFLIDIQGPLGKLVQMFGGTMPPLLAQNKTATATIILYVFWTNFGGQFILYSGAMGRIPVEILESSRLDGAGMRVELFKLILPLCWPTISMLLLLNISGIFTASGPVLLLSGGKAGTDTIAYWVFARVYNIPPNLNEPAAVGIVFTVLLFPVVVLARWALNKVYADVEF